MSGISFLPNAFGDMREDVNMLWLQNRSDSNVGDLRQDAWRARNETQDFQERMSNTAYQRAMSDMQAAGLNPMLAAKQGGADTPSGSAAVAGGGGMAHSGRSGQNALALSQIQLNSASVARTEAETDKIGAEAESIRQGTPTHAVTRDKMRQDISESVERVQKIIAETSAVVQGEAASAASEKLMEQQARNLVEVIPQIRATVAHLKAQVLLTGAQDAHLRQQIKANLPHLEAVLKDMERSVREMQMPGHRNQQAAAESFVGQLKEYLKGLIPLQGIFGSVPLGRSSPTVQKYTPRTVPGVPGERR